MLIHTKYHVEKALEKAAKEATNIDEGTYGQEGAMEHYVVNEKSILNAYPVKDVK